MKLRTKTILFFGVLIITLSALIVAYLEYSVRASFRGQIMENLRIIAEENEATYFAFIDKLKTHTIDWSSDSKIRALAKKIIDPNTATKERASARIDFSDYVNQYKIPYDASVLVVDILDDHGVVVASSRPERLGTDELKGETEQHAHYFSKAITGNLGEAFSRNVIFEQDKIARPTFHVTTRIFSEKLDEKGNLIALPAVLMIHFDSLPQLTDLLSGEFRAVIDNALTSRGFTQSFRSSDAYLVNGDRILIASTRSAVDQTRKTHIDTKPVEECLQHGREVLEEYVNHRGVSVFGASMCLRSDGLVLVKEMETDEAYTLFNELVRTTLVTGALIFSLVILVITMVMRRPLNSLIAVARAAEKVAQGNLATHVPNERKDELGILARSFNHMTTKLTESYEGLEKKVAERTRSLADDKTRDEALLDSIGEGMIAIDKRGVITVINRAAKKILELTESDALGRNFSDIIIAINEESGSVISPDEQPCKTAVERGVPRESTLLFVRKDGSRIPVALTATPVTIDNEVVGAITIFRDVTREREIERMRQDLLSLASHQLRTPLSGTKWLIETLKKGIHGTLNKAQTEYLDEIYRINERMTGLVSDMLSALRIESGVETFERGVVSVDTILKEISSMMDSAAQARQIKLHFNGPQGIMITTAHELLRNILESFVSNAITYSPENTEVFVDVADEGNTVIFSVKDSGIGIPANEQNKIFSRFYRASNAKVFNTTSSGLGLYIADTLAKKIGGQILFESTEGKGSIFSVRLPKN